MPSEAVQIALRASSSSPQLGANLDYHARCICFYIRDGSAYVVTASNGGKQRPPGWLFNVRSNPQVSIQVQDRQVSAVAEIAEADKRRELWARLLEISPIYAGYEKQTSREIPMVILRPVDEQRH